jgi:glycosyltransferase involved in cell wall biosynthesis
MLRILHVLPSLAPETGGPSISVRRLALATAGAGNDVTLYTTMWPRREMPHRSQELNQSSGKLTIRMFPSVASALMTRLPHSPALVKSVRDHSHEFDIIVNHSIWNPIASSVIRGLRAGGHVYALMPHGMLDPVVFRHNRWKKRPWALLWERANVEGASLIIFNTVTEEKKARRCGWFLRRTFIFPHIVDVSEWKNLPPRSTFEQRFPQLKDREVILYVGRINWVKNLDKLVDSVVLVRHRRPTATLVCVGPDSDGLRAEIEGRARAAGLNEHVLFIDMLKGEQLKAAYARGDVLALVSKKENFGLVAAEALASGLPVVLSEGVDLGKDWASEGPIRRVPPRPDFIAKALIDLLERSSTRGLPDTEAQALAKREWDGSRIFSLIDQYQSILLDARDKLDRRKRFFPPKP